jgi:predicted metal-binding membrane protein
MSMPGQAWLNSAASFMGIWIVMMIAMMLPSLVPELLRYRALARSQDEPHLAWLTLFAGTGYFLVWAVFGLAAYLLGLMWAAAEMQWMDLMGFASAAIGLVLLLAGAFQLSVWKARQLECCREMPVRAQLPAPDSRTSLYYGLRLGLHCCVCCVGLMAALLVTGMMNLAGMTIIAAAITVERLAPKPLLITRAAGVILLVAGVLVIGRFLGVV